MNDQEFLLFEFNDRLNNQENMIFRNPVKIISAAQVNEVMPALREIDEAVKEGYYAAGYVSYEAAPAFDSAFQVCGNANMPLLWFGLFHEPEYTKKDTDIQYRKGEFNLSEWKPNISMETYQKHIALIKDAILRGDTYQVNYTIRLLNDFEGDDFSFYQCLSQSQRGQYSAYLQTGRFRILSASPELFCYWDGRKIVTKPMKGTVKRGLTNEEDRTYHEFLETSIKNRAENLMIVDLLRNDLGRVAEAGSVNVDKIFEIETYPTVLQMTSTISAATQEKKSLTDIFSALFPCGSITGAPKVSTMGLIAELEQVPREVYCGAVGFVSPNGFSVFNVAIRTVVVDTLLNTAVYGVGGGITWDSTSEDEYNEILTKAALLTENKKSFELFETIRLENGNYTLLDYHLNRMKSSAKYFDIPFREHEVNSLLEEYSIQHSNELRRIKLLMSMNGESRIESEPLQLMINDIKKVSFAGSPINPKNRFLYHKTTYREMYERLKESRPDVFDVLLWNEKGEITEFTIGNIVLEIGGKKFTPLKECGLLPGTFREYLLQAGQIEECILTKEDIKRASKSWLINSLRNWVPVEFVNS
ncbi:aminodeoxychorismate synthase component I [Paenibacillus filicis]|uniref:Aminodeoxychorismate synthase component I n=1 Tax=Paenibacillus gyeongsangnamensis TaxID=3388067 RepID=A0ABT4Q8L3_9BACL|nr:aminodeoxychorismate synthase component I [Paenibacillus filicis]MCZ8513127.1 aminodeoxychorismate synthase component I [Paenibacillus filicis]